MVLVQLFEQKEHIARKGSDRQSFFKIHPPGIERQHPPPAPESIWPVFSFGSHLRGVVETRELFLLRRHQQAIRVLRRLPFGSLFQTSHDRKA